MNLSTLPWSVTRKNVMMRTKIALKMPLNMTFTATNVLPAMFWSCSPTDWRAPCMLLITVCWSIDSSADWMYGTRRSESGKFSSDFPSVKLVMMSPAFVASSRSCSATIGIKFEMKKAMIASITR